MKKYGNLIVISACMLAFPLLLVYGQALGQGVKNGLTLAYRAVLPSLFPAAVVCAVIGEMAEALPLPPTVTLWAQSQLCGFPLGIKTVARAFQRGLLDREQAIALSRCCANASPAFLINYVGAGILGDTRYGLLLWGGQLAISFLIALRGGIFKGKRILFSDRRPIVGLLAEGIASAAVGCLNLTGFIVFFSALATLPGVGWVHPFLEVTGGIGRLNVGQLGWAGILIGFSGLSVLLQNAGYLAAEGLPIGPMIQSKFLYALALPLIAGGWDRFPLATGAIFALFILFLISFDKRKKRRYNKQERMILTRSVL